MYIQQMQTVLRSIFQAHRDSLVEERFSTCIWGAAGIGKTDTMSQIATELDMICVPVRISQVDASELVGIPRSYEAYPGVRIQIYDLPGYLPHAKRDSEGNPLTKTYEDGIEREVLDIDLLGAKIANRKQLMAKHGATWKQHVKGVVIFFDEINRATDDQSKQAIFEFVERYVMHTYECPSNTVIVAAANPSNDNYSVNEMDQERAFMDRFLHLVLETRTDDWLLWAEKSKRNRHVRNYINKHQESLMTKESAIELNVVPSPRSWGKFMHNLLEYVNLPNEDGVLREVFTGVVGDLIAQDFKNFMDEGSEHVLSAEEIFLHYPDFRHYVVEATDENREDYINACTTNLYNFLREQENIEAYNLTEKVFIKNEFDEEVLHRNCNPRVNNMALFIEDLPKEFRQTLIQQIANIPHANKVIGPCDELFEFVDTEAEAAHSAS